MMAGKLASRAGFYSLEEIRFLRDIVQTGARSNDIQLHSVQAEVMARRVLDAYENGIHSSDALVNVAMENPSTAQSYPFDRLSRPGTRKLRHRERK
ncbi:hypothetical protein CN878_22100 [Ochrobactrum sp. 695/2009]|uniref:Uncharacterized protein n=1 Tax=Brucella intermedia TaxID=94625 RepID=A0A7V6PCU4_9HYPH|nr:MULTISPECIES: hypothetical protein [Brucella/Ochrobactrum group]PJR92395.1 hypothetical protein CN881_07470 [Ochrobactrum sp. 721/2009]PJT15782.1 hypothetical protein CN880_12495 [Ochrobactrum sp. 720/2009]PJT18359.1 hypothetical protein CN879_22255 [Ochrobactrum sp. 715/2009]PJT24001.1 hypothetical protein CN878_22100 [Ochrobactrum sp. 695/2009]PJT33532.1 hypothetical protein CN877_13775 [Ochrobactrum sp. 689/2009]